MEECWQWLQDARAKLQERNFSTAAEKLSKNVPKGAQISGTGIAGNPLEEACYLAIGPSYCNAVEMLCVKQAAERGITEIKGTPVPTKADLTQTKEEALFYHMATNPTVAEAALRVVNDVKKPTGKDVGAAAEQDEHRNALKNALTQDGVGAQGADTMVNLLVNMYQQRGKGK